MTYPPGNARLTMRGCEDQRFFPRHGGCRQEIKTEEPSTWPTTRTANLSDPPGAIIGHRPSPASSQPPRALIRTAYAAPSPTFDSVNDTTSRSFPYASLAPTPSNAFQSDARFHCGRGRSHRRCTSAYTVAAAVTPVNATVPIATQSASRIHSPIPLTCRTLATIGAAS